MLWNCSTVRNPNQFELASGEKISVGISFIICSSSKNILSFNISYHFSQIFRFVVTLIYGDFKLQSRLAGGPVSKPDDHYSLLMSILAHRFEWGIYFSDVCLYCRTIHTYKYITDVQY